MNNLDKTLPYEILYMIFQHLNHADIYKCVYVSRAWSKPAIEAYYNVIKLTKKLVHLLRRGSLFKDNRPKTLSPHIKHTRCLRVCESPSNFRVTADELFVILCNIPNLKEIDLSLAGKSLTSFLGRLKHLTSSESVQDHYPIKQLEKIILPRQQDNHNLKCNIIKRYYYLCHQSAKSIKHFKIELASLGTLNIEDMLRNSKNLTHLEIFGIHGRHNTNEVFNDSIFATCSCLTSLKLKYFHFEGLNNFQNEITTLTDENNTRSFLKFIRFDNNNDNNNNNNNNNNNKPIYNLKELTLLDLNIKDPKQLYDFIKLHKHLIVLNLQVNILTLGAWYQVENLGIIIDSNLGVQQLLNHLNSIPFLNLNIEDFTTSIRQIRDIKEDDRRLQLLRSRNDVIGEREEADFSFLGHYINYYNQINNLLIASGGNRFRTLNLKFHDNHFPFPNLSVKIDKKSQLLLQCSLRREYLTSKIKRFISFFFGGDEELLFDLLLKENHRGDVTTKFNFLRLYLPFTEVSQEIVTTLDLLLEKDIASCPNLLEIIVYNICKEESSPFTYRVEHDSVVFYELTSREIFYNTSAKEGEDIIITSTPSLSRKLNKLTYKGVYLPSSSFMHAMNSTNVTYLDLKGCLFSKDERNYINFDLTQISPNLEYLAFDIIMNSTYVLRYDVGKDRYYYDQFLKLEYLSENQPLNKPTKCYQCGLRDNFRLKDFIMEVCSENDLKNTLKKKKLKARVATVKIPDSIKVIELFSKIYPETKGTQISLV